MILIIGGIYQGKKDYTKDKCNLKDDDFFNCSIDKPSIDLNKKVINSLCQTSHQNVNIYTQISQNTGA